jgi:hypothetical protein
MDVIRSFVGLVTRNGHLISALGWAVLVGQIARAYGK